MKSTQTIFLSRVTSEFGDLVTRVHQRSDQMAGTLDLLYQNLDRRGAKYQDARYTLEKLWDWVQQSTVLYHIAGQKPGYPAFGPSSAPVEETLEKTMAAEPEAFERLRTDLLELQRLDLNPSYTQLELLLARAQRKEILIFFVSPLDQCEPDQRRFREWLRDQWIEGWDRESLDAITDPESCTRELESRLLIRLLRRTLAISSQLFLDSPEKASFEMRLRWLSGVPSADAGDAVRRMVQRDCTRATQWVESEETMDEQSPDACWRSVESEKWLMAYGDHLLRVNRRFDGRLSYQKEEYPQQTQLVAAAFREHFLGLYADTTSGNRLPARHLHRH
ncbi:MAG: hypothetical protein AAF357_05615 [Verrucomicrobiota bacterium]